MGIRNISVSYIALVLFYGFIILNFISVDLRNIIFLTLLFISIAKFKSLNLSLSKTEFYLLGSYIYFFLITLFFNLYNNSPISDMDNYSRFIAALPLYFLFREITLKPNNFIKVIIITSIAIVILSSYLYFINNPNLDRITGLTNVSITFGNMVMTIFVFLLVSLFEKTNIQKKLLISFALLCTALSWSFTMTKGSLIGLFLVLIYIIFSKSFVKSKSHLAYGSIITILLLIFTPINHALDKFTNDVKYISQQELSEVYKDKNVSFSTKERIFLLINAKEMIINNPFTGIGGSKAFKKYIADRTSKDNRNYGMAHHNHAHNDFIDLWAKTGILGLIVLVYFYFINLKTFLQANSNKENNYFRKIGIVTLLSQLGFMLTQSQLAHHQPTLFFLVILVVMSSQIASTKNNKS